MKKYNVNILFILSLIFIIGCSDGVSTLPSSPVGFAGSIFEQGVTVDLITAPVDKPINDQGFYAGSTLNVNAKVDDVGLVFKLLYLHTDGDISGFTRTVFDNDFPLVELFGEELGLQFDPLFTFLDPQGILTSSGSHVDVDAEFEIPKVWEIRVDPQGILTSSGRVDVLTGEYILATAFNKLDLNTGQYTDWNWYYTTINVLGKDYCETNEETFTRCQDDSAKVCQSNRLKLVNGNACEFGCFTESDESAVCKEAVPGTFRCIAIDSALQKANENGFYEEIETCGFNGAGNSLCFLAQGDSDAACHSCVPDDTQCDGDNRQVCNSAGEFNTAEVCNAGTCLESDTSKCSECVPGSKVCAEQDADNNPVTNILLKCNLEGEYEANKCGIKCLTSTNVCLGTPTPVPDDLVFEIPDLT
jgi:hypothetical protein